MPGQEGRFTVGPAEAGTRLDAFLAARPELGLSRSHLQRLIEGHRVSVGGCPSKCSHRLAEGDEVTVRLPEASGLRLEAQDLPLDIVFEDSDLIVLNKPRGMVVHPAAGHREGTLVNALLYHCRDLSGINDVLRPGIVHRLDKDTTGLMVAAKSDDAHRSLTDQIKGHLVRREYLALVHGVPPAAAVVEAPIGRDPVNRKRMAVNWEHGRPATTHFRRLEELGDFALVGCRLETGRTHQVRVHLASIGHPVVGDPVYAARRPDFGLAGQALHAWRLSFHHPRDGRPLEFTAEPPADFRRLLEQFRDQKISGREGWDSDEG